MHVDTGALKLEGCTSAGVGGGIFARGNATFREAAVVISRCVAESHGGGAYVEDSLRILADAVKAQRGSKQEHVRVQDCSAGAGGAVWAS